jgi:hypothetical protein
MSSIVAALSEFDISVSRNAIEWTSQSRPVSGLMAPFLGNILIKGGVPATAFWYLWFRNDGQLGRHAKLVATLLTAMIAILVGRVLANFLPFRPRPLASETVMGPLPRDQLSLTTEVRCQATMP